MILIDLWPAQLARRQRVPPPEPEPPLCELGDSVARVVAPRHKRVTDQWPDPHGPDPHGPDPVVFGKVPRVGP